ncbi:hypothetical protein BGZ95_005052 [Linnemannia exigua]|uniref:Uncharacterized protein n=1 Tax=Linnemannia exigua TaxID=604196 RepID=A0AAD4DIQ3_9FUNG|nr:hypothetical protein BGZ95_005052 [Linnemannia exigua]
MASRYPPSPMQGHQQRYAPSNQFQEGHAIPTESSDWNAYSDQSMKPSTASVSSIQSWVSTDPSSSNYANQYSQSQQQPVAGHYSPLQSHVPPRGSSVTPTSRNRSNSNNSTASGAGMSYGYGASSGGGGYAGSHLSHVSQMSNSSVYSQPQYQQQQQQHQQYQQYHDLSTYQPSTFFGGVGSNGSARSDQYSQQGHSSYDTHHTNESTLSVANSSTADNYTPNFQQQQQALFPPPPPPQQQQHQRQHRSTPSDASHISSSRAFQQDSLVSQSQSLMQSIEQVGPSQQSSPRMAHRSVPKRREQGQAAANMTPDGDLPSLDQYEAMLQKMASPTLGPSSPRETRSHLRRTEHDRENRAARQARKQQQQQQSVSMDQALHSGSLAPPPPTVMVIQDPSSVDSPRLGNTLKVSSAEERKLRRRSSLPTSLVNSPSRLLTDLRRRNSGNNSPMDSPSTLQVHPLDNPFGPRHADMNNHQDSYGYDNRRLLHVDEDDDNHSVMSEDSRLDQQRRNKRNSPHLSQLAAKPALTNKSQLRLSHTLSQTDVDEAIMLTSTEAKDGDLEVASVAAMAVVQNTNEDDRQIEQFQWELSQLQQGVSIPRNIASPKPLPATPSSSRSRATTPLGIVAEELLPMPTGPSRQQLLASMEDGGPKSSPNRTGSPVPMKSRPTTPVSGIRPPPGPAPTPPMMSAPIPGTGAYPSPPASAGPGAPRKGTRDPTRRAKPSPPVSTNIMPPTTPRPRTGSIAMIDGVLNQAPPTLPLPSLPPPPPPSAAGPRSSAASVSSDTAAQRRRKPSGGRDLVQPSAQLLAEYTFGGQDSLPTPAPSLPMTPDMGSSPQMQEKERELVNAKDEIQRLQTLLAVQDKDAAAALEVRQELETKLEAMVGKKLLQEEGDDIQYAPGSASSVISTETTSELQESNAALQQELEIFTERLQQEEAQYRTLQDTVQRLTVKIARLEAQHTAEVEQIQRDHEEFLEKVVQDHADKLTDLTEQSKTDSEQLLLRMRQEQQEQQSNNAHRQGHAAEKELAKEQATFRAREKVLLARLDEQSDRNHELETRIFELEKKQGEHDYEMDTWIKTNKSLERQLAIEQLQQQESRYQMEKVEQENRRLRAILADLDLAAQLTRAAANSDDEDDEGDRKEEDREQIKSVYERQREKWTRETQLLERKMAKAEEEATAIMEKNMELMVALEMAQS